MDSENKAGKALECTDCRYYIRCLESDRMYPCRDFVRATRKFAKRRTEYDYKEQKKRKNAL